MKYLLTVICIALSATLFAQSPRLDSTRVDTTQFVKIGGSKQFISIKGNKSKPLMLYLHGGPGAASASHREQITHILEEHFLVVHWDQRGSGKSSIGNLKSPTLSVMKQDTEDILEYLLEAFQKDKMIVVANSWGTVLGFHLATEYPNKIASLVAVSPVLDNQKSQNTAQAKLIKHYKARNKKEAVRQLKAVHIPYENVEDMAVQFKWISDYKGTPIPENEFGQYMKFFKEWEPQWMPLYKELYSIKALKHRTLFKIPVYVFIGEDDLTTGFELTQKFYERLEAPKKQLFRLKNVGHQIPMYKSVEMQNLIYNVLAKANK
ncbi:MULTISPECIES: alpha/beta fold hydrolase [Maribacter]|uniref:Alpha/beta hydrolase n=1 Tax=Maribacter flavus TaxID=1658664 RepID=A0ABU7IKA3_9FLAO|nr:MULTISPECIES: alpha/beta hydrolase [Maribacter]MDC6406255.1 alpha/beta hydrolase [Maribacter sp. PR66]MEE1973375.1 alpha/beta hydrolase [Maribacter flavus]